ncbi:amidohydrolase [Allosaccharopolyspora coralli]|nr:amidohydrolase [Allosaccharopolyspora coralli]
MDEGDRAEKVFVGGPVATMDAVRSTTDACAVRNGRIVALGSAAVEDTIGPLTEIVDLDGRLLLPGFHDAHVHPLYGGLERLRCDLSATDSAPGCLRRIEHAAERGTGWLLGGGWESAHFPGGTPTRETLDAVTDERPAYLLSRDHHAAWVNSAALRIAGLDRQTPDPPDGWIERASDGSPAGVLHEGATELVTPVLPRAGAADRRAGLLEGQRHLHSCGVTSWHDAIIGPYAGYDDPLPTYLELDEAGLLTGKVRGALWWRRDGDDAQLADLRARREKTRGRARMRAETVKIMLDGVCENLTAAMRLPYLGSRTSGLSHLDSSTVADVVRLLDADGFQVHFHAVGDRAVRDALDACAHARRTNGRSDLRHQIAHVQVVDPDDVERFRDLGVAATIQPRWAVRDAAMTELTLPYLGDRRSEWQYPFGSLRQAGTVLAVGSDWPVSEADPLLALQIAATRTEPGETDPLLPAESLPLTDAVAAATIGSAWVNHVDHRTGSLELGKDADLAVLDRDIFRIPVDEIARARVDHTFVEGRLVHSRENRR